MILSSITNMQKFHNLLTLPQRSLKIRVEALDLDESVFLAALINEDECGKEKQKNEFRSPRTSSVQFRSAVVSGAYVTGHGISLDK